MQNRYSLFILFLTFASLGNLTGKDNKEQNFNEYWRSGLAEITRYELKQARYGEYREGDAVLIFVTEEFLPEKQVKYEFPANEKPVATLKLNATKKFYTGIYPYSMMTSTFSPLNYEKSPALKVTSSSQEWCGHTFMQLNRRADKYKVELRSYFQAEGDRTFELEGVMLEDEIWTRIRLAPASLPTGKFRMIPSTQFVRLRHVKLKVERAVGKLEESRNPELSNAPLQTYSVSFQDLKRQLKIIFEKDFPYRIIAWKESYLSGFGENAKKLTTTARSTNSIRSAYWRQNKLSDSHLRDKLGLTY